MSEPRLSPISLHWLWRFSLRELFLFTLIALLGCAYWRTNLLLQRRERDVTSLRQKYERVLTEIGQFEIDNPQRPTVFFQARRPEYCWRVFLPAGTKYRLKVAIAGIEPTGLPAGPHIDIPLRDHQGEPFLLSVVCRDRTGAQKEIVVDINAEPVFTACTAEDAVVFSSSWQGSGQTAGRDRPQSFDAHAPVVLLREQMVAVPEGSSPKIDWKQPLEGLMVWLEWQN